MRQIVSNSMRLVCLIVGLSHPIAADFRSLLKLGFQGFLKLIARILSGISILAVICIGYLDDPGIIIGNLLTAYDSLLSEITELTYLNFFAKQLTNLFREHFTLTIELNNYWRHIFVLLTLYVLREAKVNAETGIIGTSIFNGIVGCTIAF